MVVILKGWFWYTVGGAICQKSRGIAGYINTDDTDTTADSTDAFAKDYSFSEF